MTADICRSTTAWARFRFSVVGSLLSAPCARGTLRTALEELAAKTWTHPMHGGRVRFAVSTIERWYYLARREKQDPVAVLQRAVRKDYGKVSLSPQLAEALRLQHHEHGQWSYKLHYDNLAALVQADPSLGQLRSYSTIRRYMQSHGLLKKSRAKGRPGEVRAAERREKREIRSYETEHVGSLWHLDFHHGSLKVITNRGQWQRPIALGILDDCSRYCCHLQWYLSEMAEDLVHGFSQGIQKCGLPRSALSDNGGAMLSEEFTEGLLRLGIVHETTLPYSPYQNGKQEAFWGNLEGRLMQMLDRHPELTLAFLNEATQAWVEIEYNRAKHREIGCSPLERFVQRAHVLRESPCSAALRDAFRREVTRHQRRSDGTISLEGVRLEVPALYRDLRKVVVRYASWDLGRVDLIDARHGTVLAPLYPLDRTANADGRRAIVEPASHDEPTADNASSGELPPLLKKILAEYSATGLPPAYLPQKPHSQNETPSQNEKGEDR